MTERIVLFVIGILGVCLLVSLGGVIYLADTGPDRPIPDVLVGTTGAIVGAIAGILVRTR